MRVIALLLFMGAALALAADRAAVITAPGFYPADAARGKKLATQCLACHGAEGMRFGNPLFHVPYITGQRPEVIFAALHDYKHGLRSSEIMEPIVAPLTLQDMRDLGAYLAGNGPVLPGVHDQGSWAHEKVHRDCTSCHGESGMGVMPGIPVLTGQHEDYLAYALLAYSDGRRKDPTMRPIAARLEPEEIRRLAEYFSKQKHLEISQ